MRPLLGGITMHVAAGPLEWRTMQPLHLGIVIFYLAAGVCVLIATLMGKMHTLGKLKRFKEIFNDTPVGTQLTFFLASSSFSVLVYLRWFAGYNSGYLQLILIAVAFVMLAFSSTIQYKELKKLQDEAE